MYALIFSVSKTIRIPNQWAQSHWLVDYKFGFIKRGLAGELFGFLFEKNTFTITILSIAILSVLYFLIIKIALTTTWSNPKSFYRILFFVIFLLSQYIVFSAHLIGYLDHIVFLLTILAVYLIIKNKLFPASVIAVFSIFIHEISVVLMLPICCFAIIVNQIPIKEFFIKDIFSRNILNKLALFLTLPFFTAAFISFFQEISGGNYYTQLFSYLIQSSIPENVADSVCSAYTKSFTYYFGEQYDHFFQRIFVSKATVFYGIPIVFLLWMNFKEFKLKENIHLFIVLILIAGVPLILHSIAYDTYRIWTFPYMILFLGFWILSLKYKAESIQTKSEKLSWWEFLFFITAFLFITLVPAVLFDGETEKFSVIIKLILILPMVIILYFLKKKLQSKPTEALLK
ncbi:hypothetical protein [Chryseobacterium profundimaris]|uniref:hypothetical protein n=1 Tax=Chryseobacterium profundimaris TaxID=1387275 RepID=UPI0024B6E72E|nr:hypothetical protein [Chryseobacterium profundimaris]